jgi:hypothetical protein
MFKELMKGSKKRKHWADYFYVRESELLFRPWKSWNLSGSDWSSILFYLL